ncbi:MAG TPA: DUF4476 domain-containing protein [Niabella sp.]|nr:DUF4476 domain-containing protein [Niabella sp.]
MNRHFLFSALFLLASLFSFGQGYQVQSKYFVYLQTEPAQPFYIKINNQKIEANASGYLILPQLKDGDYKLIVGFPQGKTGEQSFNFRIDSKDKGYLIKDYGADGWGLFDLQTMAVQKAVKPGTEAVAVKKPEPPKKEPESEPVAADDVSDFTKVLSQAANDPSLLEKPKPAPVEEKPVEEQVAVVTPPVTVQPESVKKEPESQPVEERTVSTLPSKSEKGISLVYDDRNEYGQADPITIFIPEPGAALNSGPSAQDKAQTAPAVTNTPVADESKKENTFKVEEKPPLSRNEEVKQPAKAVVRTTNAACKSVADEEDFLKLRRTMATQVNDDSMIAEAQKAFKAKCYTTAQVKYLSSMFLSNAGKYNFYAAAYPHVADKENFASLESEIKNQGYKDKFNSLLQ